MSGEIPTGAAARLQPSASHSFTMRLHTCHNRAARSPVSRRRSPTREAMLSAIDLVRVESREVVRDVTVACGDSGHADAVVRDLEGVRADSVSDRTFLMDKGGRIEVTSKLPPKTRDDPSMAYPPGSRGFRWPSMRDRGQGLGADHQEQHGGRRLRRHRRARDGRQRRSPTPLEVLR
jgi:hypothetical protein